MRYGSLSVDTSNQPSRGARSAMNAPQSEMRPLIRCTVAPKARHSRTIADGVSLGIAMTQSMPAWAAYAAAAPPALPAVGSAIVRMPSAFAMLTAAESPRALNELVGFCPSSFIYRWLRPRVSPSRRACTSGVIPSPSVTGVAAGSTSS